MGDPRRQKKKYVTPKRPFDSDRFHQELELIGTYGLRNKRELWRHRTELSNVRRQARTLLALSEAERAMLEKELVQKLVRNGVLKGEPIPKGFELELIMIMAVPLETSLNNIFSSIFSSLET